MNKTCDEINNTCANSGLPGNQKEERKSCKWLQKPFEVGLLPYLQYLNHIVFASIYLKGEKKSIKYWINIGCFRVFTWQRYSRDIFKGSTNTKKNVTFTLKNHIVIHGHNFRQPPNRRLSKTSPHVLRLCLQRGYLWSCYWIDANKYGRELGVEMGQLFSLRLVVVVAKLLRNRSTWNDGSKWWK